MREWRIGDGEQESTDAGFLRLRLMAYSPDESRLGIGIGTIAVDSINDVGFGPGLRVIP